MMGLGTYSTGGKVEFEAFLFGTILLLLVEFKRDDPTKNDVAQLILAQLAARDNNFKRYPLKKYKIYGILSDLNSYFEYDVDTDSFRTASGPFLTREKDTFLTRMLDVANVLFDPYWAQYWLLFDSPTDVLTLLDSPTLHLTLQRHPRNLITLLHVLCDHLWSLLRLPSFPLPPASPAPPVDYTREALNCVRVISRIAPFLVGTTLEDDVFWKRETIVVGRTPTTEIGEEEGQFVIDDEEDEEEGGETATEKGEETRELPALAERLLATLVDLAFIPSFTVAEECRTQDGPISYVIWEPGIASVSTLPPTPHNLLSNRLEVLRLLNLLLSLPSLLSLPHNFTAVPNRWREALISSSSTTQSPAPTLERKVVLCLLCSVLNTAFAVPPTTTVSSMPLGLGGALGAAQNLAASKVLGREDVKGLLVGTCLQFLGIMLAEHTPPATHTDDPSTWTLSSPFVGSDQPQPPLPPSSPGPSTPSSLTTATPASPNAFTFYLAKLHRVSDLDFILSGVFTLLNQALSTPLLPLGTSTSGRAAWATETLLVLWRALEVNPRLQARLLSGGRIAELLVCLVTFCLEWKDDETQMGLVRLSAFMLQSVTAERGLESALNSPVDLKLSLRGKYNVPGTLADFIIVSIYTLIFTTKARLSTLYPAFVLSIGNISTQFTSLSVVSSTRLTQLFLAFSPPSFLLMEEGNPRLVFYMLETFNNVIHYHLAENPNLVYAIIRSHKRFEELSTFTLAAGVAEVRRARSERKAAAAAAAASASSPSSTPTSPRPTAVPMKEIVRKRPDGEEEEVSEKARGKMKETAASAEQEERGGVDSALGMAELSLDQAGTPREEETKEDVFVGKNGFVPTESWVASWREGLPLDTILILLAELRPQLFDLSSTNDADSSPASIEFLSTVSLTSHLPPPPPIRPRKFFFTPQSTTWLASLLYGSIYLHTLDFLREVPVQLFAVAQARRGASASDLVTGAANFVLGKVGNK
ncbi:hypothetical protein MNV49_005855 [Pseudohyphozyma bogoriensis]|nr:hypothetical protein MNV49_005855 [Pseudohyphozyma bogoriensis]